MILTREPKAASPRPQALSQCPGWPLRASSPPSETLSSVNFFFLLCFSVSCDPVPNPLSVLNFFYILFHVTSCATHCRTPYPILVDIDLTLSLLTLIPPRAELLSSLSMSLSPFTCLLPSPILSLPDILSTCLICKDFKSCIRAKIRTRPRYSTRPLAGLRRSRRFVGLTAARVRQKPATLWQSNACGCCLCA